MPTASSGGASLDVELYALEVEAAVGPVPDALTRMSELCSRPDMSSAAWKAQLAEQVAIIQKARQDVMSIKQVPPAMTQAHAHLLVGVSDFGTSMTLLTQGVSNQDVAEIRLAETFLEQGNQEVNEAARLLNEYVAASR